MTMKKSIEIFKFIRFYRDCSGWPLPTVTIKIMIQIPIEDRIASRSDIRVLIPFRPLTGSCRPRRLDQVDGYLYLSPERYRRKTSTYFVFRMYWERASVVMHRPCTKHQYFLYLRRSVHIIPNIKGDLERLWYM